MNFFDNSLLSGKAENLSVLVTALVRTIHFLLHSLQLEYLFAHCICLFKSQWQV